MGNGQGPTRRTVPPSSFSKPVEVGKEYVVDITHTGKRGDGIGYIQNLVIFVKNAKAGDKNVKIKINSISSTFATAEVIKSNRTP
jgi:predicted RNA-binding protein with TRAM domain